MRIGVVAAVLALELHEAADRQPVERVQGRAGLGVLGAGLGEERLGLIRARLDARRQRGIGSRRTAGVVGGPLATAEHLRAGREADPELEHADLRPACRDEVPDLVDEDERAEQQDEHEDRDQALDESGHAMPSTDARREGRPDLAVERYQVVDAGRLVGALAEAGDRGLEQARDAHEVERAVEEARDRHLVRGDQRGRGA